MRILYIAIIVAMYASLAYAIHDLAGTWNLPLFWAVFAVQALVGIVAALWLDPELLKERIKPQGKNEDPLGAPILGLLCVLHFGLPAYDIGVWHLADNVPLPLQIAGLLVAALAWPAFLWTMRVNKYFSSAVRLQPERGQTVVSSGPYALVRHPGYAFVSVAFLSESLPFGSWLAIPPVLLIMVWFIYRSFLEEKLLIKDLPGYDEYMSKVRYRWIPGLW